MYTVYAVMQRPFNLSGGIHVFVPKVGPFSQGLKIYTFVCVCVWVGLFVRVSVKTVQYEET